MLVSVWPQVDPTKITENKIVSKKPNRYLFLKTLPPGMATGHT